MSRYVGEKESAEANLEAAEHWRQSALLKDGSVFSDLPLWSLEYLQPLDEYFVQQREVGEGNFFEKLRDQLESTAPEVKKLCAEMLWVMLLGPSNIGPAKKREGIVDIWSWSGDVLEQSRWLDEDALTGFASAGTSYNTNRWREMVFFINLMIAFKKLSDIEQQKLLSDPWTFGAWMHNIPESRNRQLQSMLLYLLFPDQNERIFGGQDRKRIVRVFTGKSGAEVEKFSVVEIAKAIYEIRQEQEKIYPDQELDFYWPPLKDQWQKTQKRTWLLSHNPKSWDWDSFETDRLATLRGQGVTIRYSCRNQGAAKGDTAYLVRTGVEPRGIIAKGNIISNPYEAPHWDQEKAATGKQVRYVDVSFSQIQDPTKDDPYLSAAELDQITVDKQEWWPQSSGIEIKPRAAAALAKRWQKCKKGSLPQVSETKQPIIHEAKNLILYGPPGTGKTYRIRELRKDYTGGQQDANSESWLSEQLGAMRWFDIVFATLYDLGGSATVDTIVDHRFIKIKARAIGRTTNLRQQIWNSLGSHATLESKPLPASRRYPPLIFNRTDDNHWVFTGDWQEECADLIDQVKIWLAGPPSDKKHFRYDFVTFHQAYSYEDFVEGIRPIEKDDTGEIGYQVVPGVFRRICQRAQNNPGERYALFIDEINRGNIAKIFGELITLLEPDKRAEYDENGNLTSGMTLTLPYSGDQFSVPKNLDVYGTMNTADRSIALLDTALRRRFRFRELMPEVGLIKGAHGDGYIEDGEGGLINLRNLLQTINQRIRLLLNRDMTLGHAYFMNVNTFDELKAVLLDQIIPLLQEYFYEDWHRVQLVLGDVDPQGNKREPQIICHETLNAQSVLGGDHEGYEDVVDYRVANRSEITPEAVCKVYEN